MGYDIELTSIRSGGGLFVYLVDTSLSMGHGGIRVLSNSLLSSPGQMLSYMDITVRYVTRVNTNSDILEINFG